MYFGVRGAGSVGVAVDYKLKGVGVEGMSPGGRRGALLLVERRKRTMDLTVGTIVGWSFVYCLLRAA